MVLKSESRLLSLPCFNSSAGLRVSITTTDKIATIARTTNSSIRVNEDLFDEPACGSVGMLYFVSNQTGGKQRKVIQKLIFIKFKFFVIQILNN